MIDIETIGVAVDTKSVQKGKRDLDDFGRSADKASREADRLGNAHGKASKNTDELSKQTNLAARSVGALAAAYVALNGVKALSGAIDNYTRYNAQLKLATRSQEEYNAAFASVQQIAKNAQASIASVTVLYSRLSNNLRDLNVSQNQIATVAETVALALKVQGASTEEATSAMLQLSQAFGKGRLDGDELRTMLEAAPNLMRELAKSIGIPYGALKDLGEQGKLTTDVMLNAFSNPQLLAGYRESAKEVRTIAGAWQTLSNNISVAIGKLNEYLGISSGVTSVIEGAAEIVGPRTSSKEDQKRRLWSLMQQQEDSKGFWGMLQPDSYKRAVDSEINQLRIALGITSKAQIQTPNGYKPETSFFPNFGVTVKDGQGGYDARSSDSFHQEEYARRQKEIADKAMAAHKKIHDERLKDLQAELDFEEDMRETRAKSAFEEAEKVRKQMEEDEKYRRDFIMKRNQEISDEYLRTVKEQNDKAQREYDRFYDRLSQSITDALFRGFESGKDFIQNFKDTLIRAFQTLVLQPQIEMIVKGSGVGALFGVPNIANAGGLIPGGGFGGGGNLFSTIKDGLSSLNTNVVGSIEKLGVFLSNGQGGLADKLGGFFGQYSSQIAGALSFAPAVFSLLKGDLKSAAFQGAGAGIGLALGGPVGGAIGSFLGGAIGGLFGGEDIPMVGSQATSIYKGGKFRNTSGAYGDKDLGAASSVLGLSKAFAGALGGLLGTFDEKDRVSAWGILRQRTNARGFFGANFKGGSVYSSNKYGEMDGAFEKLANTVMGPLLVEAIKKSMLSSGIKSLFDGISKPKDVQNMIAAAVNLRQSQEQLVKVYDITADSAAKAGRATGATGNALVELLNKMMAAANSYKTVGEVLVEAQTSLVGSLSVQNANSLPATLKAFDDILKGVDTSSKAGIKKFSELFMIRDQYAAYRQSVDNLKGGVRGSIFGMSSPAEQQAMMQEDLAKMFAELGRDVPGSIEELINLGKTIDYTTKEGLDLAAVFPSLVQAFQQAQQGVIGMAGALGLLDRNRFKSLAGFQLATGYAAAGRRDLAANMPSFDVGTNYVPSDMTARIHRGERIIPAADNRALIADSAAVVTELRALRNEVRLLKSATEGTEKNTRKTADTLVRVTEDGENMRTVAA